MALPDLNHLIQPPPTPATYRGFSDYATTRKNIFNGVLNSVKTRFPLSNARYTVEAIDLHYGRTDDYSLKEQQEALIMARFASVLP